MPVSNKRQRFFSMEEQDKNAELKNKQVSKELLDILKTKQSNSKKKVESEDGSEKRIRKGSTKHKDKKYKSLLNTNEAVDKYDNNLTRYTKNQEMPIKSIQDKKLKSNLKKLEEKKKEAALKSAEAELLLTEDSGFLEADEPLERTWKFTQASLKQNVDINTQHKIFDLNLDTYGPYCMDYTKNGRYLLIGGQRGHLASFDWKSGKLGCEFNVNETVRDVKWLHNETFFAAAQKQYTYIYDNTGMEIHCLRNHSDVNKLEFLPYHFLLATVGNAGFLKYQDTSTGSIVSEIRTKLGSCRTMTQNPRNAIIHLGHNNGTVTLWSPTTSEPLVKMLCHKGGVSGMAVDKSGNYMVTTGLDNQMKVWDVRTYKQLNQYFTPKPVSNVSISQMGLLGISFGGNVHIWKDAFIEKQKEPYMTHLQAGTNIHQFQFCPYEDILGLGHTKGFSSIAIPGSGEPNFDTMEANPYQTKSQRQESEVHMLLDKLQPAMITLEPEMIGNVDKAHSSVIKEEQRISWEANHPNEKFEPKHKNRGKSSSQRRYLRKQGNVINANRIAFRERLEDEKKQKEKKRNEAKGIFEPIPERTALDRFVSKKR